MTSRELTIALKSLKEKSLIWVYDHDRRKTYEAVTRTKTLNNAFVMIVKKFLDKEIDEATFTILKEEIERQIEEETKVKEKK